MYNNHNNNKLYYKVYKLAKVFPQFPVKTQFNLKQTNQLIRIITIKYQTIAII